MTFSALGLSAELLRAVADQGYDVPTPIQAQAIPAVLAGRDIMATAQTGTGKTAAFTLPLLQRLSGAASSGRVRALVLVPTRELAAQVAASVRTYGRHLRLRCAEVYGGVSINPQFKQLRQGVDIVVATPGRLIDHLERRSVELSSVQLLVLDEGDRMLDMGFMPAIERILKQVPRNRQTLLFSATFSGPIRQLAQRFLSQPETIEVARRNAAPETVHHTAYLVDAERKRDLLAHLIDSQNWQQVLVFTRTKRGADRLAKQLAKAGIDTAAIHGDKTQAVRTRALADFKRYAVRALIATDVAARGIDIDDLPHVVNFDLPNNPEDYVHRIGRTGRRGKQGTAVSLVCSAERAQFAAIKKFVKLDIAAKVASGFERNSASVGAPADRRPADSRAAPGQRHGGAPQARSAKPKRTSAQSRHRAPRPENQQRRDRVFLG